jgi:multiple antibiotic resistance protein
MDWSELLNWNEYTKLLIGLFAISTPIAAIPIFLSLSGAFTDIEKKRIALVTSVTYAITLLVFTYFGQMILNVFGITIGAFKVAGGILLLFSALEMMRSSPSPPSIEDASTSTPISIGIVPLAIPILSGPGAISTIIIYAHHHESAAHSMLVSGVIITVALFVYFLFRASLGLGPILGKTTTLIMNRVMGLIVASIAIEFILDGVAGHFPKLTMLH